MVNQWEVVSLEKKVAALEAENARLREDNETLTVEVERLCYLKEFTEKADFYAAQLQAAKEQNAQLRARATLPETQRKGETDG